MKYFLSFLVFITLMFSCKSDGTRSDSTAKDTASEPAPVVKAVCISNGVAIRAEPKKDGKWISSMMLGEVCNYLGETIADSTDKNQEFYKVELSDGAIVWARSYGLLLDAKPAAIIDQTPVYTRPDLVTKTDKSFGTAEFVVIVGEKDNWIEVVGAEKRKKGWINMDAVSTQSEEVAVATLVHKNLMDKSGNIQTEKISGFLEQLPYKETMLAGYLEDLLNESVETAIEESIYDYEELPAEESGD